MDTLRELVKIVTPNRLKKVDFFDHSQAKSDTSYGKIYRLLSRADLNSEDEIAAELGYDSKDSGYRMFKARLRQKLLNTLLFLEAEDSNFSPFGKARYSCSVTRHAIEFVRLLGARKLSAFLANQGLKKAQKFELNEYIVYFSKALKLYAMYEGNLKTYDVYYSIYQQALKIYEKENKSWEFYERVYIHFVSARTIKAEVVKEAQLFADEMNNWEEVSYTIALNKFRVTAASLFLKKDYRGAARKWEEMSDYLQKAPDFEKSTRLAEANLNEITSYLHLKDYACGERCAQKCLSIFKEGVNNWFVFMEYYFLLCMHTAKYNEAGKIIEKVKTNPKFRDQLDNQVQRWALFHTYYLVISEWDEGEPLKPALKKLRNNMLRSLLSEDSLYAMDKQGFNISVLTLQSIIGFAEKDYSQLSDKTDSLKRYISRYLNNDRCVRSRIFFNMLVQCEESDFDYELTKQKTGKLYKQLLGTESNFPREIEWMEIVPFEQLWARILESIR